MTSETHEARRGIRLLVLAALGLAAAQARGAEVWLHAGSTTKTLPGRATPVAMWGYAECTASFATCGPVTVPGPALVVPGSDTTGLTVHLRNGLAEPTSLVVPGQIATMTPVWLEPNTSPPVTYSGARPAGNLTARVRSFTHEAAPGGTADYVWPSLKAGTYLYESGTHPQVQVQMGLYGALVHDALDAAGAAKAQAYPGAEYDQSVTLVYGEVDPVLHDAVSAGTYGTAPAPTSAFDYHPKWFLVNGEPYVAGAPPVATVSEGARVLLRFVNAGLETHVPLVLGRHMELVAEDGSPYPWPAHPRQQATVMLPAAKTVDAVVTPPPGSAGGRLAVLDRRLDVTNAGAPDGGLIAFLAVVDGPAAPVITSTPITAGTLGAPYAYQVAASDANGDPLAWALDVSPAGMTISAGGLVEWTPSAAGSYPVTVRVSDPGGLFATQSFTVAVTDPNAPVITSTPVASAVTGQPWAYQATATDATPGDVLAWSLDAAPAGMTISATGLVEWTPAAAGTYPVTVRVTDLGGAFATQAFGLAVVDPNSAPIAANDGPFTWVEGGTLAGSGLLANDTDPDGDPLVATGYSAAIGTLTGNPDGSFSWLLPMGSAGTRTFTYQAQDPAGALSSPATVTVNVQADRAPVAVDDTFSSPRRTSLNGGLFPRVLAVLANDSDPDTAIDPTNGIDPATVVITAAPNKGGTATVNPDGTISFTPRLNFRGTETFRYRVRDNRGTPGALSNTATVRVNVQ